MSIYSTRFGVGDEEATAPGVVLLRWPSGRNDWPIEPDNYPSGYIDGAHIPVWCVPGHEDDETSNAVGPWYRLGIDSGEEVLLDEAAVAALRDDLTAWLNREKARP